MRFIVRYTDGDGYTYSCEHIIPIEYESAEALSVDLETAAWKSRHERLNSFVFNGKEFPTRPFFGEYDTANYNEYYDPQILTIDEWFEE